MEIQELETAPIQLEDLIRLKRLERPDEAFWKDFDRKLEAKRLKLIFKKEPLGLQWLKSIWKKHFRLVSFVSASACAVFGFIQQAPFVQPSLSLAEASRPILQTTLATCMSQGQASFAQNVVQGAQADFQVASLAVPCKTQVCYMNGGPASLNTAKTSLHVAF